MAKKVVKDNDFDLVNLPIEAQDPSISQDDFVLQQADKEIHEQKFQTKPTTFLKDSLRRFSKNKSSVVAAYILGALILLSVFVPIFNTNDVSQAQNPAFINLQPKLFENANGFWDGTIKVDHAAVDVSNPDDPSTWLPDPSLYKPSGISNIKYKPEQYTNDPDKYGKGGYFQVGYYGVNATEGYVRSLNPNSYSEKAFTLDVNASTLTLTQFKVVDLQGLREIEQDDKLTLPAGFELGLANLDFVYVNDEDEDVVIPLLEASTTFDIKEGSTVNLSEKIKEEADGKTTFTKFGFRLSVKKSESQSAHGNYCALIRSMVITTTSTNEKEQAYFTLDKDSLGGTGISFVNAMEATSRVSSLGSGATQTTNMGYWTLDSDEKRFKGVYLGRATYASFTYDTYKATLGEVTMNLDGEKLEEYRENGWLDYDIQIYVDGTGRAVVDPSAWHAFAEAHDGNGIDIINKTKCPLVCSFEIEDINIDQEPVFGQYFWTATCKVTYYKYLGYDKMPTFLFGTDKNGKDMFKYVFEGLRNSLLLGVITFAVCFVFGLLWGAVSGYFGGAVDLIMERVTDILAGVPWIVVMTLVILKAGSTFGTFVIALCLTGWIGTASTTRTQFYRFRGREYVLASRTLGASDARLIGKHILPNAMGTIITGAVLMIPSVIFSEATISYLGLGFKNLSSLGVILSNNQSELLTHPYQLIFPSVVIALVMISFNLFGNGLRDAINPSLKGEEE